MSILESGRQELLDFVNEIPEELSNTQVSPDTWTILEVLEHLVLIEKVIAKQFENLLREGSDRETPEHPVYRSAKRFPAVEAPDYVRPIGKYKSLAEAKAGLEQSRQYLFKVIEQVEDPTILEKRSFKHPYFGHLQLKQWLDFIGYHERRHLDQIKEILEMLSSESAHSKDSKTY
jgi:hypothetical protein